MRRREQVVVQRERRGYVGETLRDRRVHVERPGATVVNHLRRAADKIGRQPVPESDERVGVVRDERAGEGVLQRPPGFGVEMIGLPAHCRNDDTPDDVPIVEQIQEVVARRAGEIALVVVMRHRQHDDQVRPELERDARDERVGALGERGEERERPSRIGGLQLDEHFADRRIE